MTATQITVEKINSRIDDCQDAVNCDFLNKDKDPKTSITQEVVKILNRYETVAVAVMIAPQAGKMLKLLSQK